MINLTKNNNSLLIESDLQIFPYKESKISVPLNSIYYVLDNSNYVSFKNVNDNTTIFAVSLNELQINGEQATKSNLITLFDSVANGSMSGGGGGGSVSWNDITDKPSTFAPSEHSHLIAQVDGLQEALDGKQDTLVSGTNIKTINGETILGNGNIVIQSGTTDYNALTNKPQIAGIELSGNKSLDDLGIQAQGDYATTAQLNTKLSTETYNSDKETFALKANFWSGTQQEYEGVSSKDPNTFYFIIES